jgi:methylglutaconyl-CoA hydratase
MEFRSVQYATVERVARVRLNRPDHGNALDEGMVNELIMAMGMASRDPAVKVVHVAGAGDAFCTGIDTATLERLSVADLEQHRTDAIRLSTLLRSLYDSRKPVLAIVHGPALAAGCGIACACDFVLAARDGALFGCPDVRMGMMPALAAVFLCKRVGEGRARALVLSGETITAAEAHRIGLATAVYADDKLAEGVTLLTDVLVRQNSGTAMAMSKELLGKIAGMNMPDALEFATNMNAASGMTADCRRGVQAFLNKQSSEW